MEFLPDHHEDAENDIETNKLNRELKNMAEESKRYLAVMKEAIDYINSEKSPDQYILANTAASKIDRFEFYREDETAELKMFGTIEFTGDCEGFLGDRLIIHNDQVFLHNDKINLALKLWSNVNLVDKLGFRDYENPSEERHSQTQIQQQKYDSCLWYLDLIESRIVEGQTVQINVEFE